MCECASCCQTSDEPVAKPVVSVYPAGPGAHLGGKSSLLCLASAMFPPLVRFSWKRRRENGPLEELPPAEGEQLEIRESGRAAAAILLIHQQESGKYNYLCYVHHEGGTVAAQTEQGNEGSVTLFSWDSASCGDAYQVKLFCLLYAQLIVKSLVYCCGLSLLMIPRNKRPSTNCE
ncbi:hypothetical protein FQN60_002712, partial [Etheostoma spectabile]